MAVEINQEEKTCENMDCKYFLLYFTWEGICKLEMEQTKDQSAAYKKVNKYWNKSCPDWEPKTEEKELKS